MATAVGVLIFLLLGCVAVFGYLTEVKASNSFRRPAPASPPAPPEPSTPAQAPTASPDLRAKRPLNLDRSAAPDLSSANVRRHRSGRWRLAMLDVLLVVATVSVGGVALASSGVRAGKSGIPFRTGRGRFRGQRLPGHHRGGGDPVRGPQRRRPIGVWNACRLYLREEPQRGKGAHDGTGHSDGRSRPTPLSPTGAAQSWTVRFLMPRGSTLASLPQPNGDVRLIEVPPQKVAAIRFTGRWTDGNFASAEARLRAWMDDQGLNSTGPATYAYFDPPFKPWFLRRNEVLIPLAE